LYTDKIELAYWHIQRNTSGYSLFINNAYIKQDDRQKILNLDAGLTKKDFIISESDRYNDNVFIICETGLLDSKYIHFLHGIHSGIFAFRVLGLKDNNIVESSKIILSEEVKTISEIIKQKKINLNGSFLRKLDYSDKPIFPESQKIKKFIPISWQNQIINEVKPNHSEVLKIFNKCIQTQNCLRTK